LAGPVEVGWIEVDVVDGGFVLVDVAVDVGFDVEVVVGFVVLEPTVTFVDVDEVVCLTEVELDATVVKGGKTTLLLKSYTSNRLGPPQNSEKLPLQSYRQRFSIVKSNRVKISLPCCIQTNLLEPIYHRFG
jgi:hypothetical protein